MDFKNAFIIGMLLYIVLLSGVSYIAIEENDLSPPQHAQISFEQTESNVNIHVEEIYSEKHNFEYITIYLEDENDTKLIQENIKEGDSHTIQNFDCEKNNIMIFLESEKQILSYSC